MLKKIICILLLLTVSISVADISLAENNISIDFEQVPLGSVLRILSSKTGRKFITDTKLSSKKIVLHLKNVTPDEAVNALLDTYDLYYVRQSNTNIFVIKSKKEGSITTVSKIFYCNYAKATSLVSVLQKKLNKGGDIQADDRTNSLIVTDMADNIDKIAMLILELDSATPQVLLEVRLLDIKITKTFDSGINLLVKEEGDADAEAVYVQPLNPSGSVLGMFETNIIREGYDINAVLEAIQSKTDAEVLNNPKLLVLNNQQASITIVDEIPYQELTSTEEGGQLATTAFKEVGISLTVKPLINKDGTIILTVNPTQSYSTGDSVSGIPVINTSNISTTFMLNTGETAVIGGLIRETRTDSEYKIPILGDIPILGYLFKKISKENNRSELTIFVSATIVE